MTFKPSPRQALAMFSIVFGADRSERWPDMRALGLKPRERQQLVTQRLLELDLVKPRGQRASLTEDGWAWVQEHLDAKLEAKSPAAKTLRGVLKCLSAFLPGHGHALSDLVTHENERATRASKPSKKKAKPTGAARNAIAPTKKTAKATKARKAATKNTKTKARTVRTAASTDASAQLPYTNNTNGSSDDSLGTRIRDAALAIAGAPRRRVRLRDLRARLADVPRERLDRQLFSLQESGALVLYRIDDPTDIDSDDEQASVRIAGFPRHILYLEH